MKNKHVKRINLLLSILLGAGVFIFFGVYYSYHLHYQEQFQMFLFTSDYFVEQVSHPGGMADYLGGFLTQFYYYSWAGAAILTGAIGGIHRLMVWIANRLGGHPAWYPLTLLPSLCFFILFCDENFLLSGAISVGMVLGALIGYTFIENRRIRLIYWGVGIPLLYLLAGGCAWLFIPLIWITEFCRFAGRRLPWWILVGGTLGIAGVTYWISLAVFPYPADRLLWAIGSYRFPLVFPQMQVIAWLAVILVPLLVARLPEKMTWRYYSGAWVLQFILMLFVLNLYGKYGIGLNKEEVMGYDYHVRMQEWDEVIAMAEKKAPDTPMSVSCLNLALAMKGQLPERMFSFYQRGKEGLLMSFVNDFTIPLVAGEPYYYLGLVNVAQQFVFEAMEAVPDYRKSVRCFKRLAETNLINGRYEVARKYLRILQHTLFYKDWATETLACLNDEDRVNAHPEYGRLRRLTPRTDFFFNPDLPEMTLEFLLHANPLLADWITEHIGPDWITDLPQLKKLAVYADDDKALQEFMNIKFKNKERLAKYILEHNGVEVDPHSIFDVQVKRLHEYKRQLLNILHVIYLYNQIKMHPEMEFYPRTFIFGAKASAGYATAKKIIKLINSVADVVNNDASINGKIKVVFIENYRVSNAEWIFAAADVSEQISTASKEASGTGNMKFMLNGAPTLGTMDGANVEIVEEVGAENAFIFGLSSDEVINYENNGGYDPNVIYNTDEEIRQVLMQLINGTFSNDTELFRDLYDSLLNTKNTDRADRYFILADFRSYADAQKRVEAAYRDEKGWAKKALLNTACSGKFTSDRTIQEYVDDIWHLDKVIVRKK